MKPDTREALIGAIGRVKNRDPACAAPAPYPWAPSTASWTLETRLVAADSASFA